MVDMVIRAGRMLKKSVGGVISGVKKEVRDVKADPLTHKRFGLLSDAKEINGSRERLSNLYTGKKMNPLWVGGVAGGYVGTRSAFSMATEPIQKVDHLATNVVGQGQAEVLSYDGVSNEGSMAPPNLNATGDIVFGLHNRRRG